MIKSLEGSIDQQKEEMEVLKVEMGAEKAKLCEEIALGKQNLKHVRKDLDKETEDNLALKSENERLSTSLSEKSGEVQDLQEELEEAIAEISHVQETWETIFDQQKAKNGRLVAQKNQVRACSDFLLLSDRVLSPVTPTARISTFNVLTV